jgi:hypothetical protein
MLAILLHERNRKPTALVCQRFIPTGEGASQAIPTRIPRTEHQGTDMVMGPPAPTIDYRKLLFSYHFVGF